MLGEIQDFRIGQDTFDEPVLRLIFGGYSWKEKRFVIWKFHFNPGQREFIHTEIHGWSNLGTKRKLLILGDPVVSHSAVKQAKRTGNTLPDKKDDIEQNAKNRFLELLRERGIENGDGLNMEPFEVLRDLIRSGNSPYIGGAPQLVKIYQHMNTQPFAVRWPSSSQGAISILGRILTRGEKVHVPVIDPDTFKIEFSKDKDSGAELRQ